jgi:O-antigen/teichoic acid export membrane protein
MLTINRLNYQDLLGGIHRVKVARADIWSIASLSWPTFTTMVSQRIGMLSDSVLLLMILGPAAATVLFLNKRLASIIESVLRSFSAASWPALVELNARGERDLFNRRLEELSRIVVMIAIAALVPAVCFNEQFVTLWVGSTGKFGTWIAAVGSLNALLVTLSSIFTVPLVTTGNVRMLAVPSLIAAAVNVAVSVAMTFVLGPIGPLVGTTVALTTVNLWHYPRFLQQTFGTSPSRIFRACLPPIAWGFPFAGVMALLAHESGRLLPQIGRFPGLFTVMGLMGCGSLLFVAFSFVVILSAEERALWKARLLTPLLRRLGR